MRENHIPPMEEVESSPLDVVERMIADKGWPYEYSGENQIEIEIIGGKTNYKVAFTWMDEMETLHFACAFNLKVPPRWLAEVERLVLLINRQMWVGHFDILKDEGTIMFRHGLVLMGASATTMQCEAVFGEALDACECYFTAFNHIIWTGAPAEAAFEAAVFETEGNA